MIKKQKTLRSKLFICKHRLSINATNAEAKFKEILDRHGIIYRFQKGIFTRDPLTKKKKFRILDFYITRCRIGIEIDGGYHFTSDGKRQDYYRDFEISCSRRTLTVWRFTNEEVFSETKVMMSRIENLKEVQGFRMRNHRIKLSELDFLLK